MPGEDRSVVSRQEHRRLEKALRESVTLRKIAELLTSTLDLEQLLRVLVKHTTEACEVERCAVWLFDDALDIFRPSTYHMAADRLNPKGVKAVATRWYKSHLSLSDPVIQQLLNADGPLYVKDLHAEATTQPIADTFLVGSVLLVALKREGRPVGMMSLDNLGRICTFSEDQQQLAQAIGQQATIAIDNARLYQHAQTEQRRAEQLIDRAHAIYEVAMSVNSGQDLSVVLDLATGHLARGLEAFSSVISLLDDDGETLHLANRSGVEPPRYSLDTLPPAKLAATPHGQYAARTGIHVFVQKEQAEGIEVKWCQKFGLESILIVPLMVGTTRREREGAGNSLSNGQAQEQAHDRKNLPGSHCIGLAFVNFKQQKRLTKGQYAFAQDIAAQCALAIDKARLLAEAHKAAELANERANLLDAVFQAMREGIAVTRQDGEVLISNKAIAHFLEVPVHSRMQLKTILKRFPAYTMHGQPLKDEEHPLSRGLRGEYIRGERFYTTRADGTERVLEVSAMPLLAGSQKQIGLVSAFRDVTEQVRAEFRIRQALETLLHIAEAVSGITDIHDILRNVLERTLVTLNCKRGLVQLYDERQQVFTPLLSVGFTPQEEQEWLAEQKLWLGPEAAQVYSFHKQIMHGHATLVNAEQCVQQPNPFGHIMVLAAPITHNRNLLGLILLDRSAPSSHTLDDEPLVEFTIWDLAVVEGIAQLAGLAIEQAHWQQEAIKARASEAAMREANALKDEFLAITAHEFRTPLTVILAHSQVALRALRRTTADLESGHEPSTHLEDNLTAIEEQTRQLNNIVTTFLEVTRLNRGQLTIKAEEVDLAAIACMVVHNHTAVSEAHTINCVVAPSEQPYIVKGDPARLEQVIANLVENAIKYSPFGGPVTVSLRRHAGKGMGEHIEVCVEDQGIGVPLDAQPHLFERFYRAPDLEGSKPRGIGLGLYIVAQVLQLHGGSIHVESNGVFGEGSRFIFTLPALLQTVEVPHVAPVEQNNAY